MSAPSEHEAYLRAALHAAADSLEPRDNGLERITARLRHSRPRAVVWLTAAWDALRLRAPAGLQDAFYWLSSGLWITSLKRHTPTALQSAFSRLSAALQAIWDRFAPASAPGRHRSTAQGWLRPLAAMAVVIFIVAAGTYVAIDISTAVSPSSTNVHPPSGKPGPGHSGGAPTSSPSRSGLGSGTGLHNPSASPTCSPSSSPQPSASVPASPSTSPSPTPSASPTPAPSSSTTVVSAVQLTSVTEVSSAQAMAALTQCPTPSTSAQTPAPSTDAGATQANQAAAALVPPPGASPTPVKLTGKHRIHP